MRRHHFAIFLEEACDGCYSYDTNKSIVCRGVARVIRLGLSITILTTITYLATKSGHQPDRLLRPCTIQQTFCQLHLTGPIITTEATKLTNANLTYEDQTRPS